LIQSKDTNKNTQEPTQLQSSKISIIKDTHKFTSTQFISSAKMEVRKSRKSSIKEKPSTKLCSIPPLKIKSSLFPIKALKIGNYKKTPHLSLMNLPKSINFKIFTLTPITNHLLSALRPITFYVGISLKNVQSTTSLLNKSNVS
jgi:hypothetical protein